MRSERISTHTPLARCDGAVSRALWQQDGFLLTHLLRGVTSRRGIVTQDYRFLLTHLLRGVTRIARYRKHSVNISTHTPLARCDKIACSEAFLRGNFYSHTSCEV